MCGRENQLVSVVIPAFRSSGTIARPIDSLLCQTRRPDEILVVDDGSPDDIASALARFGNAVTLVRKPNGGAASARNFGIERARGGWIAFLDADDYWESEKLQRQLDVVAQYPEVNLVAARWFQEVTGQMRVPVVLGEGENLACFARPTRATGEDVFRTAMQLWTSTLLVRRELIGGHRFESGIEPAEDRDMWIRLVKDATVYILPQPLATYVQEPGSLSRSNIDRDCENMLLVTRRYADLMSERSLREWEAHVFRRWAGAHLSFGRPSAAIRPACRRLIYQPFSPEAWWVVFKGMWSVAGATLQ